MSYLQPAVSGQDHRQGAGDAPLQLVEYGDYQCSFCGQAYPAIKAAQQALGGKLAFVFRNFPLPEVHPNAKKAAIAAEAAAVQGKFWEMHDALYEHQAHLDAAHLLSYAQQLGLNIAQFKSDLQNNSMFSKIEVDFESGIRSGVNGTPSFFLNGQKYEGDWEGEALTQYLLTQVN
jgi:protein-disulfide isomerase